MRARQHPIERAVLTLITFVVPDSLRRCTVVDMALFAAAMLLASGEVFAATYRYASSSNRIYVENGGTATLSAIKAALPSAPLDQVSAGVWLLRANLVIEDGTLLQLHGTALGGDVNELRLKSDSGGFISVMADVGAISVRSTKVTSWNAGAAGPDTDYSNGRAFIRVRSRLAADGVTALESRMDIVDSVVAYLGYNASESYGLVWKVVGSGTGLYDKVNVYGDIINSEIHHNYFGVYTYGHEGGQWLDNHVHHNVKYGIDPHDDSDNLVIEGNDVHDNGNHGIIASQRCHNVTIRGNRSYANTGNGIMLHRSSNNALVEDNDSYLNTDSGVAIFASSGITVRNNRLLENGNAGVRLSVGAANNIIESNDIGFSGKYGFYFYKGSDAPNSGDDGRNKGNTIRNNQVHDIVGDAINLADSDNNTFSGNTFARNNTTLKFTRGKDNRLVNNTIPSDVYVRNYGTDTLRTTTRFTDQPLIKLQLDSYSTGIFTDPDGQVFDPDEAVYTTASTSGSTMSLNASQIGSTSTVHTRNFTARPASGSVQVNPTIWNLGGDRSKAWNLRSSSSSVSVAYRVGDLAPGVTYDVYRGSTRIATLVADSSGAITFNSAPNTTSTVSYTVKPR